MFDADDHPVLTFGNLSIKG